MSAVPTPTIKLTEDQGNNLIFAIISNSYEEYAMRCAIAGVEPMASPGAFGPNRGVKDKDFKYPKD